MDLSDSDSDNDDKGDREESSSSESDKQDPKEALRELIKKDKLATLMKA